MQVNRRRIAKNTLMLYLRMALVMVVSLFTTRIILKNLGEVDFGIYNVVGGIILLFGFLNSAMSQASQRFISFELASNDIERVKKVFFISVVIHIIIAITILVLAETIGLWFVSSQMNFPPERYKSAIFVYQFAILTFIINVITVPFTASIIAHEKMNIYAWVSIIDTTLKLTVAYLISIINYDKLQSYSLLIFMSTFSVNIIYWIYCRLHFQECKSMAVFERAKFYEMFSFAGWNIIGNMAFAIRTQGSNILLNIFFGPSVNAARGIAHQVGSAVQLFVTNFQTASNPQIVKTYASEEYSETLKLVCQCTKYSFYLILLLSLPILFQTEYILTTWLDHVPYYSVLFVQLILINEIIDTLSISLKMYVKATGKIKWYMIIQGGFYLFALPVIWLFLKNGFSPTSSLVVLIIFTFTGTFLRLFLIQKVDSKFSSVLFIKSVLPRVLLVSILSYTICLCLNYFFKTESLISFVIMSSLYFITTAAIIWLIGLDTVERSKISVIVKNKINKIAI